MCIRDRVLSERVEELHEYAWELGAQDADTGLIYLQSFAPDMDLQEFEERVCCVIEHRMLVDVCLLYTSRCVSETAYEEASQIVDRSPLAEPVADAMGVAMFSHDPFLLYTSLDCECTYFPSMADDDPIMSAYSYAPVSYTHLVSCINPSASLSLAIR